MNSSKTTTIWIIVIIILLIIVGFAVAYIYYMSPGWAPSTLNSNYNQNLSETPTSTVSLSSGQLGNGTYSLYGDTFTLGNGQATIQGHGFSATSTPLVPVGYTYAASGQGDISGYGEEGSVVAMYRSFGANLEWVALFAVTNTVDTNNISSTTSGTFQQIASGIVYQNDSKVQSINVDNGVITLNLLVVSAADQSLPHYEQTPTAPLTLQFQIQNGQFVPLADSSSTLGKG